MCLCLASQKPSEREFFLPTGTHLGVKLLMNSSYSYVGVLYYVTDVSRTRWLVAKREHLLVTISSDQLRSSSLGYCVPVGTQRGSGNVDARGAGGGRRDERGWRMMRGARHCRRYRV